VETVHCGNDSLKDKDGRKTLISLKGKGTKRWEGTKRRQGSLFFLIESQNNFLSKIPFYDLQS